MRNFPIKAQQTDQVDMGRLQINVTSALGARPIPDAKIAIYYTGEPEQQLEEVTAVQNVKMVPTKEGQEYERFVIPAHTLFGDYPPKIAEAEIKPVNETGEIVLSCVVVPEYVIVHDGVPTDSTATNYWVRYKDYIKNVASSEIYATWTDAAIRANVLAIMSFTLNRVYTEW